jgi:hypothetical protein
LPKNAKERRVVREIVSSFPEKGQEAKIGRSAKSGGFRLDRSRF